MKNHTKNYIAFKICLRHNFEMAEIIIHACSDNAEHSAIFNKLFVV